MCLISLVLNFADSIAGFYFCDFNCWFVRDVTVAMLVVKNKNISRPFSPLGTKLHFHVNSLREIKLVLTTNMAVLSCGCKPRIGRYEKGH